MKSKMEDVIEETRIVNKLDKRGKLAILRDLQKQGLEVAPERPAVPSGRVGIGDCGMVPEISVTRYKEAGEK